MISKKKTFAVFSIQDFGALRALKFRSGQVTLPKGHYIW